jgi:peptidoglycan hydrolase-like protein with peptidoglycan-binding domain
MKKIIITLSFLGLMGGAATSAFAGYFNTTPIARCDAQITRTLQVGSENNEVYMLQSMLSHGNYLYVSPNGYFGPSTKAAVKRFQVANGVDATGIVGEATRNAVNERLCDADVRGDSLSYNSYGYGYNSGTTYVDSFDPYIKVISPQVTTPAIYATPQEYVSSSFSTSPSKTFSNVVSNTSNVGYVTTNGYQPSYVDSIVPATTQIKGTNIVYNPATGYSTGITQNTGSVTISLPRINSVFNEGDTVNVVWTTENLNANGFQIFLENTSTNQSKQISTIRGNTFSFQLTKELLDAVCNGSCNQGQNDRFKIVISTPVTDIAGITTNFRAGVSPITINRPYSLSAAVTLTSNTSPVNSGTAFKLYVNSAAINLANPAPLADVIVKLRATCTNAVSVSIAGIPCGQELSMPASVLTTQTGVPVMITNTTWYKQEVAFDVVLTTLGGQIIGTARTTVIANPAPFNW